MAEPIRDMLSDLPDKLFSEHIEEWRFLSEIYGRAISAYPNLCKSSYLLLLKKSIESMLNSLIDKAKIESSASDLIFARWITFEKKYGKLEEKAMYRLMEPAEYLDWFGALQTALQNIGMRLRAPDAKMDMKLYPPMVLEDAYLAPENWSKLVGMIKERERLD
jgi:hypothetical protein